MLLRLVSFPSLVKVLPSSTTAAPQPTTTTVGSNTSFGVNGSVSSTADYTVDSFANLALTNNSNLQQSLGTSASAANVSTAAASALETAATSATKQSNAAFGSSFEAYESMVSAIAAAGVGGGNNPNFEGFVAAAGLDSTAWLEAKGNYEEGIKSDIMSSLVNTSTSSSTTDDTSKQEAAGIIKGSFLTENTSNSKIAATAGEIKEFGMTAIAASETALGSDYQAYDSLFSSYDTNGDMQLAGAELTSAETDGFETSETGHRLSEEQYTSALSELTEKTFESLANTAGSGGEAYNKSIADVSVTGVGSIASLNAADSSVFNTNIETRSRSTLYDNNGTANGSAGGSLSTASFANQSNSQSASAFMQAFGADTVDITPNGTGGFDTTVNARFDFKGVDIDLKAAAPQ